MNRHPFPSALLALVFCLSAVLIPRTVSGQTPCKAPAGVNSTCVCQADKGIIDLRPLSHKDGTPRFTSPPDGLKYTYDYNPCQTFSEKEADSKCKDVFICQISADRTAEFAVGSSTKSNKGEQMYQDGDTYYIHYEASDHIREGRVYLNCDQNTVGKIENVTQAKETGGTETLYSFHLYSCHACPGGCSKPSKVGYIGIIIIVLLAVAIITYFIVGAVLMKFRYEATGSDIIPNKGLWIQLPLLIKDGCVFTFSPCVNFIRSRRNDYQKI